jgi:YkoY family integral membrane protein
MDLQITDLFTVGLLVILEGLLSADNALVVAVMILGLPRGEQKKALKYGLVGAFIFRTIATLLAVYLIRLAWVKLLGGLYLVYLAFQHFFRSGSAEERSKPRPARAWIGLSALWATILKVELVNIAFSVDSILVAVAISSKTWVVLCGGLLGIVAMRVVISWLLGIVRRYPTIVDGAFVIIALVGAKLLVEYARAMAWIDFDMPKWLSLGLIAITFLAAYAHARRKGPVDDAFDETRGLLEAEDERSNPRPY